MSKKNSEKEIEEAHRKIRGEEKSEEKKADQKKQPENKEEKKEESKETKQDSEKSLEKNDLELAEEQNKGELSELTEQKPGKGSKEIDLEEIARHGTSPSPAEAHDSKYIAELSHKPMGEIYKEIKEIYKTVEDKGYLSPSEQRQVQYLNSAVEKKFEDEEQGIYSFSEQAARAASVTQHLSASMIRSYKGKK